MLTARAPLRNKVDESKYVVPLIGAKSGGEERKSGGALSTSQQSWRREFLSSIPNFPDLLAGYLRLNLDNSRPNHYHSALHQTNLVVK